MYSTSEKAKRLEFRTPDPSANPYFAFPAMNPHQSKNLYDYKHLEIFSGTGMKPRLFLLKWLYGNKI